MRLANNLLNTEIVKAGTFTILVSLTLGGVMPDDIEDP